LSFSWPWPTGIAATDSAPPEMMPTPRALRITLALMQRRNG
jgi:hypothetical protein